MHDAACHVRTMRQDDLAQVLAWRNHDDVRRAMITQHLISAEEHARWFDAVSRDASRRLLVAEDQKGPFGFVQFSGVARGGVADWGFYSAPDAARGSGRAMGTAALTLAFREMGLHKVCGQALAFNGASIRFHEKLGFQREGVLRQQQLLGSTYHDVVCFGLLRDEFETLSEDAKQ